MNFYFQWIVFPCLLPAGKSSLLRVIGGLQVSFPYWEHHQAQFIQLVIFRQRFRAQVHHAERKIIVFRVGQHPICRRSMASIIRFTASLGRGARTRETLHSAMARDHSTRSG